MTEESISIPVTLEHCDDSSANPVTNAATSRRVGVLVMGMHRSGSSAITRTLALLGCALPKTPMALGADNPRGHWESQRIADFNDEILALAGSRWNDWLPVNPRLSETLIWPQLIARGRDILREEFAEAPLFVLKDPRICRLGDFWLEVLAAEGIDAAVLLPLRNPIEVARSLAARNGIDEHQGLLIWLRHVLAAEAASRNLPRVFVDFAGLLTNREAMAARISKALEVIWPRISALSDAEISEFITPDLRHQISEIAEIEENQTISPWIRKTYEVLLDWARHGEKASDYSVLDSISCAFDEASPAFARPMLNGILATQRIAQAEEANIAIALERDEVSQRLVEVDAELARTLGSQHALVDERETLAHRLGHLQAEFEMVCAECNAHMAERDKLVGELAALSEERNHLAKRLGEAEAECHKACVERDARAAERDALALEQDVFAKEQHRNRTLSHELQDLQNRLADQESALRQKQEEAAQAWAEVATERDAVASLHLLNDQLGRQAGVLTRSLKESEGWVFRLAGDRRQFELKEMRLTREIQRLAREIASLNSNAANLNGKLAVEECLRKDSNSVAQKEAQRLRETLTAEAAANAARTNQLERGLVEAQAARLNAEDRALQAESQKADLEQKLAERFAELAELEKLLRASDSASKAGEMELARTKAHLNERFGEIAKLTRLYQEQQQQADKQHEQSNWLRSVHATVAASPRWWAIMPEKWRQARELRRLARKGLFDGHAYLARYPDVAEAGMEPLRHYILHGMVEGRTI